MTKEQTKEVIKVMQAFVDGKEIEVTDTNMIIWRPCPEPFWKFQSFYYRIKPEPKYRPYEGVMELLADITKHGGWIKDGDTYRTVVKATYQGCRLAIELSGCKEWGINELPRIEQLTWADDGTPFGKLVEE